MVIIGTLKERQIRAELSKLMGVVDNLNTGGSGGGTVATSNTVSMIANLNLSGHRVVKMCYSNTVAYADKNTATDIVKTIGLSTHSAMSGEQITICTNGEIEEPSWDWDTLLPIFLGNGGVLTQTTPTDGFILQVGIVLSPTRIYVRIGQGIMLN